MNATIAKTSLGWKDACSRFETAGLGDVYFRPEYAGLYAGKDDRVEAFVYEESGETFFMPYLRRPLPPEYGDVWDFETAYGYGGPLSTTEDVAFLETAWHTFMEEMCGKGVCAGFIRFHPLMDNIRFAPPSFVETQFMRNTVMLSLPKKPDDVWREYRGDVRNKIQKARKSGVTVEQTATQEALKEFARMYRQTMCELDAASFYMFRDEYFDAIGTELVGSYEVYIARIDGKPVGGVLTLASDRYVHLHLSATDRETRNLGTASLLRHTAIESNLQKNGIFHFGGGTTNEPDDSLLRFKRGFSAETAEFWIGKVVIEPDIYNAVCAQWERNNPDKISEVGAYFQKYRYGEHG